MANPVVQGVHSAPGQYAGKIHFRGEFAYLENMDESGWSLLQYDSPFIDDSPFIGVVDGAVAARTASTLRSSYNESDRVIFHGVLSDQSFGVVVFCVLFVC
jgi:hypothetical protein